MSDDGEIPSDPPDLNNAYRAPVGFGVLLFGFGLAAGVILAFSGYAVLQDSASVIVTVFLAVLFLVALVGSILFLLRKPILRRVFGVANAQMDRFAEPLSRVAEAAVDRDPRRATASARDLVRLTLARYAWLSTRRWIVASLTGLIAAMAALAGTALLFKQNELLAAQSVLLAEQNEKIQAQSAYLAQDVQLAEAARNAQLAVEITRIAEELGVVMENQITEAERAAQQAGNADVASLIPVLRPGQLGPRLLMRIVAASRAVKPYRFLEPELNAHDDGDKIRVAMQPRRAELALAYENTARFFNWTEPPGQSTLIDRPASPERAQLLQSLIGTGLRDYELLNFLGLDLSFAWGPDMNLFAVSMQGAQLSYANFDRAQINGTDLSGAALENLRLRRARILNTRFDTVAASAAKPPYRMDDGEFPAFLAGADFREAVIQDSSLTAARAIAAVFDGALLAGVDFSGAQLGSSSFRGSVILAADFTGAALQSADFDGALVFSASFLEDLGVAAAPETFRPDRFELEEVGPEALEESPVAYANLTPEIIRQVTEDARVWRVRRVKPFEDRPAAR